MCLGGALLAGLAVVTALAAFDRTQRARLETTSETTAVGDVRYFRPPADPKLLPVTGATFNGQPLVVASIEEIGVRDTHLRRVAVDPASGLTIYALSEAASAGEYEQMGKGGGYLLKLAPNEYVIARPSVP